MAKYRIIKQNDRFKVQYHVRKPVNMIELNTPTEWITVTEYSFDENEIGRWVDMEFATEKQAEQYILGEMKREAFVVVKEFNSENFKQYPRLMKLKRWKKQTE